MNSFQFVIRSLKYHKKQHLWVFLAAVVSTAVLTGALVIGDSVKYSLSRLVDKRLGKAEYALITGDRFVRSLLAEEMGHLLDVNTASVLMMKGLAVNTQNQTRIPNAQILGVDSAFWNLSDMAQVDGPINGVAISQNVAEELLVRAGDEILLRFRNNEVIPVDAPFSAGENFTSALRVKIVAILNDNQLGRFSLLNNQLAPFNIFINRDFLANKLGLSGLANLIVVASIDGKSESDLNQIFHHTWKLGDAQLSLSYVKDSSAIQLLSDRVFIDKSLSDRLDRWTFPHQNILTYFVNSISCNGMETPFSFVTAASESVVGRSLKNNEMVINDWLAEDLHIAPGDSLRIGYFHMGPLRKLVEKFAWFQVVEVVSVESPALDASLMPAFPGLTEAGNCRDWESGIPIDLSKIRDKDEQYWANYRGLPKAYISLSQGHRLWENPFGNYTAIRFSPDSISLEDLKNQLLQILNPADVNLKFVSVRKQGKAAASNGVDFGQLFLSLSFFVMAAALLLLVLIFSLNVENRRSETGIAYALGFSRSKLIGLRMMESFPTILFSALMGGLLGIGYNMLMLWGLNSVWNEAVHADMIIMEIRPQTIVIGIMLGVLIAMLSIYMVTVKSFRKSVVSIIRVQSNGMDFSKVLLDKLLVLLGWGGTLVLVCYSLSQTFAQSTSLVLVAGFLFLVGGVAFVSIGLNPMTWHNSHKTSMRKLHQLAWKNVSRNKGRSMAVIWLLALGTFTIIVTGANRKTFFNAENERSSGTGGFVFWLETSVPLLHDLNQREGAEVYGLNGEDILESASFVHFFNLPGDDASCLNLNQVQLPQILGVDPLLFDSLKAFSFSNLLRFSDSPWLELKNHTGSKVIPAFADQTVIQWGLMRSLGDTLYYLNERGDTLCLKLMGGLSPSVFQGNILIDDSTFLANFPSSGGSEIMLVEVPSNQQGQVEMLLKNRLVDYGVEITSTSKRLAAFYSVTNTYLTIFMILGGLGVILGTIGMGIVLMRNMLDRRHELAVLKALGFAQKDLFWLIVMENIWLLLLGIGIGIAAALIGILPSLMSPAFHIPGSFLFLLISGVFMSGITWILLSTYWAIRQNRLSDLQNE